MKTQLLIAVTGFAISFAAIGCGSDAPERYHLKGMVTYDGKPLPAGEIILTPDGTKGNKGPQGRAKIVDGIYDTSAEGAKGVLGGAYQITIHGFDGKSDPSAELPMGKPLFQDYRIDKDLPPLSDVTEEAVNMDFAVPKQASQKPRQDSV